MQNITNPEKEEHVYCIGS